MSTNLVPPVTQPETIEDGSYQATVSKIGDVRQTQYGDYISLSFDIEVEDGEMPITLIGGAGFKLSSGTKLGKMATALMNGSGVDIFDGAFSLDSLVGRTGTVRVHNKANDEGTVYSNVVSVSPSEQPAQAMAQAPF